MSSLKLSDITLTQMDLTRRRQSSVVAVDARPRYKVDPQTRQRTDEVEGFNVDIICGSVGKAQTVKLNNDPSIKETIQKIQDALNDDGEKLVYVSFGNTLKAKPYALINNGQLVSGISARATSIKLDKVQEQNDFDDFIDDEIIE